MTPHARPLRIGISANFMPRDPERALYKDKALQYFEEKMALALFRAGCLPLGLFDLKSDLAHDSLIANVDGLLLSGGADVSPKSYGEEARDPAWEGDHARDTYEGRLIRFAIDRRVPVLGICRGIHMLNVALGGTLYQDIESQVPRSLVHRDWQRYEAIEHVVRLADKSWIRSIYGSKKILVNTVHHQGIKDPAGDLVPTAWAADDVVEALECIDQDRWLVGIQWHPEWLDGSEQDGPHRSYGDAIFDAFLEACAERRG
jgi:putative glutamine amidotransferase